MSIEIICNQLVSVDVDILCLYVYIHKPYVHIYVRTLVYLYAYNPYAYIYIHSLRAQYKNAATPFFGHFGNAAKFYVIAYVPIAYDQHTTLLR